MSDLNNAQIADELETLETFLSAKKLD